jgi:ferrous iron transport protein A
MEKQSNINEINGSESLASLPVGLDAELLNVTASADEKSSSGGLSELGFVPGARVRIVAKAAFGGPLAVRVGSDTFALRRIEANTIQVRRMSHG